MNIILTKYSRFHAGGANLCVDGRKRYGLKRTNNTSKDCIPLGEEKNIENVFRESKELKQLRPAFAKGTDSRIEA